MRPRQYVTQCWGILFGLSVALLCWSMTSTALADDKDWRIGANYMRLINDLDMPQDGWCLDVVGSGPNVRFDMPLIGHNCKPGLYADEAVIFRNDGTLYFPAFNGCVTVMGLNKKALPGAAIMLKACGETSPFLTATNFQHFSHRPDGRVELKESNLCLTLGASSHSTFDVTHAWRTLYVDNCNKTDPVRSTWRFVDPLKK